MHTTNVVICPNCGAENDPDGMFCAECGESLSRAARATSADTQTTSMIPVAQPAERPYQDSGQRTAVAAPPTVESVPHPAETPYGPATGYLPPRESLRGAVLGWIALILALLIFGFFAWSTFLGDGTRNSITGIFT